MNPSVRTDRADPAGWGPGAVRSRGWSDMAPSGPVFRTTRGCIGPLAGRQPTDAQTGTGSGAGTESASGTGSAAGTAAAWALDAGRSVTAVTARASTVAPAA